MAVPYTFGSATTSIPLSQLDSNFATAITLGNTAVQLGNTITNLTGVSNVASATSLSLGTSGNTTAVTIDTSQRVGIGTATPAYNLDVRATNPSLNVQATTGTNQTSLLLQNTGGSFYFGIDNSAGTSYGTGTAYARALWADGAYPMAFVTNSTERMRIDSSGNVGIGTTSPAGRLHVSASSDVEVRSATTGANYATFRLKNSTQDYSMQIRTDQSNAWTLRDETAGSNRFLVDTSGNFYFGTNGINVPGPTRTGTAWGFGSGANNYWTNAVSYNGVASHWLFINGNGTVGSIQTNGSSTSYNTSSDYRLKEDIALMTGALDKVAQLRPVTYKWKVDGSSGQGFIAHELQAVVPDCVTGEKDAVDDDGNPKYQAVDTSFLVATLTSAIQEQQALINALTARVVALEAK